LILPVEAITPLLGRVEDCFSSDIFEAIDRIYLAAHDLSPESVEAAIRYFMEQCLRYVRIHLSDGAPSEIARIQSCFSALERLYCLPAVAPPFELFRSFWNALFGIREFSDTDAFAEFLDVVVSLVRKPIPDSLLILQLALIQIAHITPRCHRATIVGHRGIAIRPQADEALFDLFRVVMAAICTIPNEITLWEHRAQMVQIMLEHQITGFARPPLIDYTLILIYEIGMIIGQMILFEWIPEGYVPGVYELACRLFAVDDPINQPDSVCGALNVIIAGFLVGQRDTIFREVPDFYDRCQAFITSGGMYGKHNKLLIGRWLNVASDDPNILLLREAYINSVDIDPNEKFDADMNKMEDFVGLKERQIETP
jgi:hypothetical protein